MTQPAKKTNQEITPEQILKLAQICEPDKKWQLVHGEVFAIYVQKFKDENGEIHSHKRKTIFDPLNNPAQLMQVVFAIANKVGGWKSEERSLIQHLVAKDADGIINLAIEVLT